MSARMASCLYGASQVAVQADDGALRASSAPMLWLTIKVGGGELMLAIEQHEQLAMLSSAVAAALALWGTNGAVVITLAGSTSGEVRS